MKKKEETKYPIIKSGEGSEEGVLYIPPKLSRKDIILPVQYAAVGALGTCLQLPTECPHGLVTWVFGWSEKESLIGRGNKKLLAVPVIIEIK